MNSDTRECAVPPRGWRCTRGAGHDGPCAAVPDCTCDVHPPRCEHGRGLTIGRYRIYLSRVEDDTQFDPACPFHGDDGSMVGRLPGIRLEPWQREFLARYEQHYSAAEGRESDGA